MPANHRLKDLAISESGFVFDPYSGATFTVNRTGLLILHSLTEGLDEAAIIKRVRESFRVASDDVASDVRDFVRLLIQNALLPADFSFDGKTSAAGGGA